MRRRTPKATAARALVLTLALVAVGCARAELDESLRTAQGCVPGDAGCLAVGEYIVQLEIGDAGYGARVLIADDEARSGLAAFQLRLPEGETELRVLRWNGNETSIETVDSAAAAHLAFAKAPLGNRLYLAYQKQGEGLMLALWDGSAWTTRVLDENPLAGPFLSMAIDVNGGVHISYIDVANRDLRYLLWQDGAFLIAPQTVDTGLEIGQVTAGGNIGSRTSLTLMPSQEPVITYYDESNGQLRTARYSSVTQEWEIEVIARWRRGEVVFPDSEGVINLPSDRTMIARASQVELTKNLDALPASEWAFKSETQIKINAPEAGAEYAMSYATPWSNNYGAWNATAWLPTGQAVTFYDTARSDLVWAFNDGPGSNPSWTFEIIDGFGAVGDFHDMAIVPLFDANGVQRGSMPVVAYYDQSNADLKMAVRQSGAWTTTTLDAPGITGLNPSIAVSEGGWVVVAYHTFDIRTGTSQLRLLRTVPVRP